MGRLWYVPSNQPDTAAGQASPLTLMSGRKVLCDAASGLAYLHEKRIVHYDLKPQNVLVSDSFVGKLADVRRTDENCRVLYAWLTHVPALQVGSCKRLKSTDTSKGAGTEDYQAPEARARNGKTNESSDIYSFGVMVWEVKKHRSSHTQFPAEPLIELCNWDGPTADVLCGVEGVHGGALADCDYIQIVGRRTKQARWPGHESSQSLRRPTALELVAALNTLPQDDI